MSEHSEITEQKKLPARVLAVVERCSDGQRLCKSLRHKETGETELSFCLEPSGKRVGPKSAQQAIASGLLSPLGDGLLGPESSQTWAAK